MPLTQLSSHPRLNLPGVQKLALLTCLVSAMASMETVVSMVGSHE